MEISAPSAPLRCAFAAKDSPRGCPSFFCAWENVVKIGEELTEAKGANDDGLRFRSEWEKLAREVVSGMKEWRIQHPRATW